MSFQGNHPCIRTSLEKISLDAANQKFNIIKTLSGQENKSQKVQSFEWKRQKRCKKVDGISFRFALYINN